MVDMHQNYTIHLYNYLFLTFKIQTNVKQLIIKIQIQTYALKDCLKTA